MKMKARLAALAAALCMCSGSAVAGMWDDFKDHLDNNWTQSKRAWTDGRHDVYVSGLIWHAPWAYEDDENWKAYGLGLGKSVIDEKGRTHGLYALAFQDSNYKPQYNFGYTWTTYWQLGKSNWDTGLGYTAFIFMRSDFSSYMPIPAVLPVASLRWDKRAEIMGTYVPGFGDRGNVAYFFVRFSFP
jgi:Antimicrobial peptide resistance and lipid A acylation protein PagP